MAFACQRNSYLKELVSKVVSCVPIKEGYEVVLNDTVFFPEGGGQVCKKNCLLTFMKHEIHVCSRFIRNLRDPNICSNSMGRFELLGNCPRRMVLVKFCSNCRDSNYSVYYKLIFVFFYFLFSQTTKDW